MDYGELERIFEAEQQEPVIVPLVPAINIAPGRARNPYVDDKTINLMFPEARELLKSEKYDLHNTALFTCPTTTTDTLSIDVESVSFNSEELIKHLVPTDEIVYIHSNFGNLMHESYQPYVKQRTSNRGRKKKAKRNDRKMQGNGSDFNSQITFEARSKQFIDPVRKIKYIYKFKVFHINRIQLPGAKPEMIDEIFYYLNVIVDMIRRAITKQQPELPYSETLCRTTFMYHILKNYKFMLKMRPYQLIDLLRLEQILEGERDKEINDTQITIHDFAYSRHYSNIKIRVKTPSILNAQKITTLSIFMRGKVNILAAVNIKDVVTIFNYINDLFTKNSDLIVIEGAPNGTVVNGQDLIALETPYVFNVANALSNDRDWHELSN